MKIIGGESPPLTPSAGGFVLAEDVVHSRLRGGYVRLMKPALDRMLGLILFVLVSPIVVVAGLFILVTLGPPIIYAQERIGLNGEPFRLYKLRTMIPDRRVSNGRYQGDERRRTHKSPHDPRVVPAGKVLRALRLDELPQFWNVVKGDMSLVGPRPEMPEIVKTYQPWQHQRHLVKPGVTGPWQISARNGKLMHECTEVDLGYITRVSLVEDLRILMGTPLAMIGGRKGY